tara:strand:+ start:698 stop:1825 length:1128 start_codon:yes stop_codon:yes gene_type:complete
MSKRDYYEVLEVPRDANEDVLKKAYRRLAMKHHPDRNPDDAAAEEAFKECKEAYEILSDPRKRSAYDQFGHAGVDATAGGGAGPGMGGFRDIFDDVFGDIFGARGGGGQRVYRGADLRYNLELNLEEACAGLNSTIEIPTTETCEICGGDGAKPGTSPVTCGTCQGVGQVRMSQGFFSIQQTCPHCKGRGTLVQDRCGGCHGAGKVRGEKKLSVKIPAGVDNGDRIRLAGEGEAGERGGPSGDLYVEIHVREHEIFTREESHLYCEVPIGFVTAALGGELEVPTLDGRVSLKIPSETQTGRLFRLRGKGVKSVRGGAVGDLLCRVVVETPVNLTAEQKEILGQLDDALRVDKKSHSPQAATWFDGVKRFFEDMRQ